LALAAKARCCPVGDQERQQTSVLFPGTLSGWLLWRWRARRAATPPTGFPCSWLVEEMPDGGAARRKEILIKKLRRAEKLALVAAGGQRPRGKGSGSSA
jgi:hypothetical protein